MSFTNHASKASYEIHYSYPVMLPFVRVLFVVFILVVDPSLKAMPNLVDLLLHLEKLESAFLSLYHEYLRVLSAGS